MTLFHRINAYYGKKLYNEQELHAYKAVCGAEIIGAVIFKQFQTVAVGQAPHAQCAKCFGGRSPNDAVHIIEGDRPVANPNHNANALQTPRPAAMYDEHGRLIPIGETGGTTGQEFTDPYNTKALNVKDTQRGEDRILRTEIADPLGTIERNDFG